MPQPQYSPYLAPSDFWLFPRPKIELRCQRFAAVDIRRSATSGLYATPQEIFRECYLLLVLLLPLALQPAVGFGLSNNTSPFFPVYHQVSPFSHSQHLKISFYFFSPSFPGSSSSSRPFQSLSEDFWGILFSSILSRLPSQLILCSFIHFTIFSPLLNTSSSRFVLLFLPHLHI